MSSPKGGRKTDYYYESIYDCAMREWFEETGISTSRVQFLQGAHLDEARTGTRYLLAECGPPDPSSNEPDACGKESWTPPQEDPDDDDPIVSAQWVCVEKVVRLSNRNSVLEEGRVTLLKKVVGLLRPLTGVMESCWGGRGEEAARC